jgi:hypothetical protein
MINSPGPYARARDCDVRTYRTATTVQRRVLRCGTKISFHGQRGGCEETVENISFNSVVKSVR